jgi:hypothetical protein
VITKLCQFSAVSREGEPLVQVFHPGDMRAAERFFSKTAAPLLPEVRSYLERVRQDPTKIHVLVNALGAGEYWGSNINGDWFSEDSLIHKGPDWGYETFYQAHPFTHHQNKDPAKAFGTVPLSVWNDAMKRVELVIEIDRRKADQVGATGVCDKIDQGIFSDVSMGCRVPFDRCSICCDLAKFRAAQQTFDPSRHKNVGAAVLEFHKKDPIRGISITRNDYCDCLRKTLNKIQPDGRRICAINDYPKFFDISFVFIGADKTAKVMAKLASAPQVAIPSWYVAEEAYGGGLEKAASAKESADDVRDAVNSLKTGVVGRVIPRTKQAAQVKASEILKDIVPSQFGGKPVRIDHDAPELPNDVLDQLGKSDLSQALSTASSMGMLLRPREFQRIVIISCGNKTLADKLDEENKVFPPVEETDSSMDMGPEFFSSILKKVLLPHLEDRSLLEPVAKRRVVRITIMGTPKTAARRPDFALEDPFLQKISAAYNGYLDGAIHCLRNSQRCVSSDAELWAAVYREDGLEKSATGGRINPAVLLGAVGGAYALSAMADWERQRAMMGAREPVGPLTATAADYPKTMMLLAALAALHQQGSNLPSRLFSGLRSGLTAATTNYQP